MGEIPIEVLLAVDKIGTGAVLALIVWQLWKRYTASSDKLIAALAEQTTSLVAGLGEVKSAVSTGLGGLSARVDAHAARIEQHDRTLAEHARKLDRHGEIIAGMSAASGLYARPRLVGEEEPPR